MADYVKAADLAFAAQLKVFAKKLPNYQMVLGLTPAQTAAANADADFLTFVVLGNNVATTYKQGWTDLKNATRTGDGTTPVTDFPVPVDVTMDGGAAPVAPGPGVETRFRSLVGQIKANPAYTNAMGEDLGIVADESSTPLTKPELTVKVEGGNAVIGFKKGSSDGIKLYSKRGEETAFSFLAVDTRSPYVDNRPNETAGTAETRTYQAYFIVDDEQVGGVSDDISVNV